MKVVFTQSLLQQYKKANVRIRNAFDNQLRLFKKDPNDPVLNNHELQREWQGFRSINITADWRAIYKEITEIEGEPTVYFVTLGTHRRLYK